MTRHQGANARPVTAGMRGALALAVLATAGAAHAGPSAPGPDAAVQQSSLPLYGAQTPGSASTEIVTRAPDGTAAVRNVSRPTLTPVLPAAGRGNGAAAVVAPGGAFVGLATESEGFAVARALAERGIAAFVLKYRVNPTPAADADAAKVAAGIIGTGLKDPDAIMALQYAPALEDGLAALAMVRRDAARYGVDPQRVGMIGFSAGAMTALSATLKAPAPARPAFLGYIYGPQVAVPVAPDAPPMFAALASDDPLFAARGFPLVEAWRRARRPVELHYYQKGGHGFGLGKAGTTTTMLAGEFVAWLDMNGFLRADAPR